MSNQENKKYSGQNKAGKSGFGVAPSPFNGIKLELGVILVLGLCVWMAAEFITADEFVQLLILFCFGASGTVWLLFRTKRLLDQQLATKSGADISDDHQ